MSQRAEKNTAVDLVKCGVITVDRCQRCCIVCFRVASQVYVGKGKIIPGFDMHCFLIPVNCLCCPSSSPQLTILPGHRRAWNRIVFQTCRFLPYLGNSWGEVKYRTWPWVSWCFEAGWCRSSKVNPVLKPTQKGPVVTLFWWRKPLRMATLKNSFRDPPWVTNSPAFFSLAFSVMK